MRKLIYTAFVAAMALSMGCAITNYPTIYDTRGAVQDEVLDSYYDKAYLIPSSQIATGYDDGTDELFTLATQTWRGDRRLFTYNNFDPSGAITFLDQTYCDPTRADDCAIATAWDPDLPDSYPHGAAGGLNDVDDVFDYVYDGSCSGARSLSLLLSVSTRIGECGSGIWADKQAAGFEFSLLEKVDFRGLSVYHVPMDSSVMSVTLESVDGTVTQAPIYGQFNGYVTEELNMILPVSPNARYQQRWLSNYVANFGTAINVNVTYGSMNVTFRVDVQDAMANADRI